MTLCVGAPNEYSLLAQAWASVADEAHGDCVAGLVLGRAGGAHDQRAGAGDVDLVAGVAAEVSWRR